MQPVQKPSDEHIEIGEKIRSGEFFRESRLMYDFAVHDPMAERYFYLLVSVLSGFVLLAGIIAVNGLYPLKHSMPFIVSSTNITDEYPSIHSLLTIKNESASAAVLRFVIQNYVTLREEYDIDKFDRNTSGIKSQSTPQVFEEYQRLTSPTTPESPITLYQRHSKRNIQVLSTRQLSDSTMEATFEATVISKTDVKKSSWQANITFNYSGIALDESTGKVIPFTFTVTGYKVKRLQDVK
jgi:type IV secretion system protein VirB8